jgi:hypothetical protein
VRRVLHISQSDALGGSGRSAYRLHSTLRKLGHRSRMLVGQRRTSDPDVRPLKRSLAWRAGDRIAGTVADLLDLQYVFYPSSFGVASDLWFKDADVVQLYNTHGSYFSHKALPYLSGAGRWSGGSRTCGRSPATSRTRTTASGGATAAARAPT